MVQLHIRGLRSALMAVGYLGLALAVVIGLPSFFMQVCWNALVFETFSGPAIHVGQALLLWLGVLVVFKLLFNPQFQVQFQRLDGPPPLD